jgi:hypothetical protein
MTWYVLFSPANIYSYNTCIRLRSQRGCRAERVGSENSYTFLVLSYSPTRMAIVLQVSVVAGLSEE